MSDALNDRLNDIERELVREFAEMIPLELVVQATRETLDHYRNARVPDFVPLFVQLETRRRLLEMTQEPVAVAS